MQHRTRTPPPPLSPPPFLPGRESLIVFNFCLAFSEVLDYRPIRRDVLCVGLQEIRGTNELTNQQRFSMAYTLLDHRNKIKMFKAQVEPRAAGEWFHCTVLKILTS